MHLRVGAGFFALLVAACAEAAPHGPHYAVGDGPGVVIAVDLNGDGSMDLVVANERGGDASVLLGDGHGRFDQAPGSPFPVGHLPNDVASGDFDRDRHPDLAFADHETQQIAVLLGDGRGGFAPAPYSPVTVTVKPHVHGLAVGDFNRDGLSDLVTDSWGDDRLQVLLNDGKAFHAAASYVAVGKHPYQRVRVADLDGDGNADIVSPNLDGGDVTILLGDGKGGFRQPPGSPFPCGDSPFNVAIGDVNADGKPDLAIVNSPSSSSASGRDGLTVLIGDGHGGFRAASGAPFAIGRYPNLVAIGDLDGDGVGDIAVSQPDEDRVTIFWMSREGTLSARRELSVAGHPKGLAIADLDDDGKADLAIAQNAQNRVTVMLGGREGLRRAP